MDIRNNLKVGFGYDSHKFSKKRKLFLCGLEIEGEQGLEGHSDADLCLHSIIDALLSTTNLGDIGENFPSEDEKYKDISSVILLKETIKKIKKNYKNFEIINLNLTILAEKPKISPLKDKLKENLSKLLKIEKEKISISAKTQDKMGFIGREEGMACFCICLVKI